MGMASVSTTPRKLLPKEKPQPKLVALDPASELSIREQVHEHLVLFARRRMLDWKMPATRSVVVLGGSALVFTAWKGVMTWLG
jgi:hypothetical protein